MLSFDLHILTPFDDLKNAYRGTARGPLFGGLSVVKHFNLSNQLTKEDTLESPPKPESFLAGTKTRHDNFFMPLSQPPNPPVKNNQIKIP